MSNFWGDSHDFQVLQFSQKATAALLFQLLLLSFFTCNVPPSLPPSKHLPSAHFLWLAHMVSSSCQVSIGAGAQIAWRWPPTKASCPSWTQTDSREVLQRVEDLTDLMQRRVLASINDQKVREKHAEMNHHILIYTWLVIAK